MTLWSGASGCTLPLLQRLRYWPLTGIAQLLSCTRPVVLETVLRAVSRGARPATYDEADAALQAVVASRKRLAGSFGCLPRSIAAALLCRMRGSWPRWCVGTRVAPPFRAHAWLEADGRMVRELGSQSSYCLLLFVDPPG